MSDRKTETIYKSERKEEVKNKEESGNENKFKNKAKSYTHGAYRRVRKKKRGEICKRRKGIAMKVVGRQE